jgi:nucleoside-diphosphate-sugar epimerase
MDKVLVTGAGGFIGFNLVNHLARHGHNVIGVDFQFPDNQPSHHNEMFRKVVGDFRDWDSMKIMLEGVRVVFHLAAAHLQINMAEKEYWDINVNSLSPLLELANQKGVQRFIHVSSVGVYGKLNQLPADENTSCYPQSIYGETKLTGENEVIRYQQETEFPVVILRPAWVYGTYCPRTLKLCKALSRGRFIKIGRCENYRHPIYIKDMIKAFMLAMESQRAIGETIIVAGQKPVTTNELVDGFCRILNYKKPGVRIPYWTGLIMASFVEKSCGIFKIEPPISTRTLEFFNTNNAFETKKAKDILDFTAAYSFEKGIEDCKQWILDHA